MKSKLLNSFLFTLAVISGSTNAFADNPPYGPVEDPWAGCTDALLDNETSGLLGVSCAIIPPPNGTITPALLDAAKNTCIKQPNGTFGEIRGQYLCFFPTSAKPGNYKPKKGQFTVADWKQFRPIAGRAMASPICPPHNCEDLLKGGPIRAGGGKQSTKATLTIPILTDPIGKPTSK